jgi:hypothetical protein
VVLKWGDFFFSLTSTPMAVDILTLQDLQQFKEELLSEIKTLLGKPEQKKWLKTDEVKKLLQISPGTLQTLRINGTLQFSRVGNIIYYDADHIQKMLEKNLHKAKPL